MNKSIIVLAQLRASEADHKTMVTKARQAIADSDMGQKLDVMESALQDVRARKMAAEEVVRHTALAVYEATENKKPHTAASIAMYGVLDYDEDVALAYAIEHLTAVLKLDKALFEKVAKVLDLDFVSTRQEPRVKITKNLSKYIPAQEDHAWALSC